ncbi:MAG: hypothetical protein WCJ62_00050 [Flavobacterium sp.]
MTTTQNAAYPLETFGPYTAIPNGDGGYQLGAGNLGEVNFFNTNAPAAVAAGDATLTAAQIISGIVIGSPGSSAAAYTLPTVANLEAALPSLIKVGAAFDFTIINANGSSSGVITVTTNTGWSIGSAGSQGLMTIAATAGTSQRYRARKTGSGTWSLYQLA